MGHFAGQTGVVSDQPARHEAGLVRVYFGNGPGGDAAINQISVHLTISIHRGNRAVVGYQSGVAFLVKEAEVGKLEVTTVRTVDAYVIRQGQEDIPEGLDSRARRDEVEQSGG